MRNHGSPCYEQLAFSVKTAAAIVRTATMIETMLTINTSYADRNSKPAEYQSIRTLLDEQLHGGMYDTLRGAVLLPYFLDGIKNDEDGANLSVRFSMDNDGEQKRNPKSHRMDIKVSFYLERGRDTLSVAIFLGCTGTELINPHKPERFNTYYNAESSYSPSSDGSLTDGEIHALTTMATALINGQLSTDGMDRHLGIDPYLENSEIYTELHALQQRLEQTNRALFDTADEMLRS